MKDKLQKGDQKQVITSLREILPEIRKANKLLVDYEKLLKDVEERTFD